MDVYNNRLDRIDECPDFHPESILKFCLDSANIGISRTSAEFYTVRLNEYIYPTYEERFGDVLI